VSPFEGVPPETGTGLDSILHNVSLAKKEEAFLEKKIWRKLLKNSQKTLQIEKFHPRITACNRVRIDTDVLVSTFENNANFHNLVTCRNRACPTCYSKRIADQHELVVEIMKCATKHTTKDPSDGLDHIKPIYSYMATLTISHGMGDSPGFVSKGIRKAFRAMFQGKFKTQLMDKYDYSYVSKFEITYGQNGWHPHIHVVFMTPKYLEGEELEILRSKIFAKWETVVSKHLGQKHLPLKSGFHLDRRDKLDYLAELKLDWEAIRPMAKKHSKNLQNKLAHELIDQGYKKSHYGRTPLQLIITYTESGKPKKSKDYALYIKYHEETKRLKELTFSGDERMKKWRKEAQKNIEEKKEQKKKERESIAVIPGFIWDEIRDQKDFYVELLYGAETKGFKGVRDVVAMFLGEDLADCVHEPFIDEWNLPDKNPDTERINEQCQINQLMIY
jgi:hypothetical protein